jgi:hypothetical protein
VLPEIHPGQGDKNNHPHCDDPDPGPFKKHKSREISILDGKV